MGREVFLRKKKNDKKEKGNEKTCRERRQKKQGQNNGNFPTQRNFEWAKDKNETKKKKKKGTKLWELSHSAKFRVGKRTKILGKHIASF